MLINIFPRIIVCENNYALLLRKKFNLTLTGSGYN